MSDEMTFGRALAEARKEKGLSQKELASQIKREEDGEPISPQYLNDIEHDRRKPSSDHLIQQFFEVLGIDLDYLYYLADRFPEDIRQKGLSQSQVTKAMRAFRGSPSK
ncbi:MAG: helix-turn-helix transcriptional regulator [Alphaproteobacteria bacterium]|nr:helix-turn-helix transcriptional regulator [Alphaproteobacteria bacterium]